MSYSIDTYMPQLKTSWEYQDFVCVELMKLGIALNNIQSTKFQEQGENLFGMEIKYSNDIARKKVVYIETAEKSNPDNADYVPSGIYRSDNTWLYAVGDYAQMFIFSVTLLRIIDRAIDAGSFAACSRYENGHGTSLAYLMPLQVAHKWCAKHVHFTKEAAG